MKCAVIGLGSIGARLVPHITAAGIEASVWNRSLGPADQFRNTGVGVADTPAEACHDADVVLAVLTDEKATADVLLSQPSPLQSVNAGAVVVDLSTIHPAAARELATQFEKQGCSYVDAPFTGGYEGADAGALTLFCGGSDEAMASAKGVMEAFSRTIAHLGSVGAGQLTKSVNQVILAHHFLAVAEAVAMCEATDLDPRQVLDLLGSGAAASWVLTNRSDRMIQRDFPPAGKVSLHLKDLGIALSIAGERGQMLPGTTLVAGIEQSLVSGGFGNEDLSCIVRYLRP